MSTDVRQKMTKAEWEAEGTRRFGPDQMSWQFVCPACGHVAAIKDWKEVGAPSSTAAFSCVGRWLGATSSPAFGGPSRQPCNYAGGGLFHLNPVLVDGIHEMFAFADATEERP